MGNYAQQERGEMMERSKIMVGRTPNGRGKVNALWWRVTIYVGDSREDIDAALAEALRIDSLLLGDSDG
jgi:phosphoglycolate phosphatase-like HAD superfamily hydrolase